MFPSWEGMGRYSYVYQTSLFVSCNPVCLDELTQQVPYELINIVRMVICRIYKSTYITGLFRVQISSVELDSNRFPRIRSCVDLSLWITTDSTVNDASSASPWECWIGQVQSMLKGTCKYTFHQITLFFQQVAGKRIETTAVGLCTSAVRVPLTFLYKYS